jgi:hypothetical protein
LRWIQDRGAANPGRVDQLVATYKTPSTAEAGSGESEKVKRRSFHGKHPPKAACFRVRP